MTVNDSAAVPSRLVADVAIVGAGPAGITVARELVRSGLGVVLVEGGEVTPNDRAQSLLEPADLGQHHDPMHLCVRAQVGGTSNIWGGRCVPYDPVDFERRSFVRGKWPIGYTELEPYFARASDVLVSGPSIFDAQQIAGLAGRTLVPGLPDGDVRTSDLERWSLPTNFARYIAALTRASNFTLATGLACTEVVVRDDGSGVAHLVCKSLKGAETTVHARRYVLAAGGLATTRLLLASDRVHKGGIGNHSGHLGRWYMIHVDGKIADVRFTTDPQQTIYDHERDDDGTYVRRRFTFPAHVQVDERIPNIAMWLVNPEMADTRHGSGVLSLAYLLLASPIGHRFIAEPIRRAHIQPTGETNVRRHLRNIVVDLPAALRWAVSFGYARYLRRGRRAPGFFIRSASNEYPLHYHAEHLPNPDSRVTLDRAVDALGMRRLKLDLRMDPGEAAGVVRAHRLLDDYLRKHRVGSLAFRFDDLEQAVRGQFHGGPHQVGTTRMSDHPDDGVVDQNLAVHGFDDLYVASSSAFVTSSQANTTFLIIVFALRLADHLRATLDRGTQHIPTTLRAG